MSPQSNKSDLVKRLGIHETVPCTAETIIVDVSQLFYHIVWPHGGSPSDIIASIKSCLCQPPTFASLSHHILRAHLQVMLWKAVDHQAPPCESTNITHFVWEIQDGIPVPTIDQSDLVPPELMEVVQCQCKAQGKMCSTLACGCRKEYLSCTSYCNCSGEEGYCNPHTKKDKIKDGTEMVVEKDFEDTYMDEDIEEDEGFDTEYFNEDFTIKIAFKLGGFVDFLL